MMSQYSYDMDCMERGRGGRGGDSSAAARRRRQQSSSFAGDWSFELGHMAIFGGCGDGSEEAIERAEARVADQALVDFVEGVENAPPEPEPEPEEECEVGSLFVVNPYTQDTVSEASVVALTDEETGEETGDETGEGVVVVTEAAEYSFAELNHSLRKFIILADEFIIQKKG